MSLYILIAIALFVGVLLEYRKARTPKIFYYVMFAVLALALCFRFGQGTDYFNYRNIFNGMSKSLISVLNNDSLHTEAGWKIVTWLFRYVGIEFTGFIFILSILQMWLLSRFLNTYCKNRFLGLFLSYHTLYLTYMFSALRQGFVILVFLGVMLKLLDEKKYILYAVICALCATIHSVSWMFLIAPIVQTKLLVKRNWQIIFVLVAWAVGLLLSSGVLHPVMEAVFPKNIVGYMNSKQPVSILAVLERIGTFSVIFFVYWYSVYKNDEDVENVTPLMRIATMGIIIYGCFFWQPLIASRLSYPFKVVEIAILSSLLYKKDIFSKLKLVFCTCLFCIMFIKGIHTAIDEGEYKQHVQIYNYPYFSIYDKDDVSLDRFMPSHLFGTNNPIKGPYYSRDAVLAPKIKIN